jgi:cell division protease FtsH
VKNDNQQKIIRFLIIIFFVLFIINLVSTLNRTNKTNETIQQDYTAFVNQVMSDKIKSVSITEPSHGPNELKVVPKEGREYLLNAPKDNSLIGDLRAHNVEVTAVPEEGPSFLETFFFTWGPTIFFLAVWIVLMKKMSSGGKGLFTFNKSKAQLVDPSRIKEGFKDVVGCDEAKVEAQEFVDFLKSPEKFTKLGGRTPRGLLLTGPAGTGKTMLARALAKESGVPFFHISGSEFVEMFVGVGAARVRDMFETAKKVAPCILFIDEIDAIGGKRGSGNFGGGHDEREQTLNQILVELDGMDTHKGVILVGATNRPEILDKALLRPGRIDRQIVVGLPDVNGREQILKIHSTSVPLSTTVNLAKIARGTPGFSGAELANLINEAAIFAARRGKKMVEQNDLEDAKDKIMMGVERPSLAMDVEEKRDTAYHESGHAIVARLVPNSDPVHKVTIIPRGRSLGLTMQLPEKDHHSHKIGYLTDKIAILMGGRLAEEIFCDTMTNGASNDIKVATNIARAMVTEWGMSDLGPIAFGDREDSSFLGQGRMDSTALAPQTQLRVDEEVQKLIIGQYQRAKQLLIDNRDKVEAMTAALMEIETLDDWQIENIMQNRHYDDQAGLLELQQRDEEKERKIADAKRKTEGGFLSGDINPAV